ncbi:MAG: serine hydroxymethyltransferase, partial [Clostridia bacterium]
FVTSGIRIGTPAATTRGMNASDMAEIARLIHLTATSFEEKADYIRECVNALCDKYPLYE